MARALTLLILLAACSGGGGSWPSLARRPIEGPPIATGRCATAVMPTCGPAGAVATTADPATSAGPTAAGVPAGAGSLPPADAPVAAGNAAPPRADSASPAVGDVPAQLALVERDLADAAARLAAQRDRASAAVAAARGVPEGSEAWARAETERTALDRVGNQIGDIRARLDGIAGSLAAASAAGTDVAAPLAAAGRLIARATALQADYDAAAAALR